MQNNVINIRITSLYWSQPSSVVFACKTASFGSELQASIGPCHHLWFCAFKTATFESELNSLYGSQPSFVAFACKTATLGPELQDSIGPRPQLFFFAFKTATLAPELQVSTGASPHLWFLHAKQRL